MTDITPIPLGKLVVSEDNVRRTAATDASLQELAVSIVAHGLVQSIVVRKHRKGKFAVVVGGRRLAALQLLAEQGRIDASFAVPLSIINTGWDPALGINWNNVSYLVQANGQYNRLSRNLAVLGNVSADATNCYLIGGHCNLILNCNPNIGCPAGRYDNGVHIECGAGSYACGAFDPHVAHDDTVSPWIGNFSPSVFFTGSFWEHGFVDLIGGTFFVGAFSQ